MAQRKLSKKDKKGFGRRLGRRKRESSRGMTLVTTYFGPQSEADECCPICQELKASGCDPSQPVKLSELPPAARERIQAQMTPLGPERIRELLVEARAAFPPGFLEGPWQESPLDDVA